MINACAQHAQAVLCPHPLFKSPPLHVCYETAKPQHAVVEGATAEQKKKYGVLYHPVNRSLEMLSL